MLMLLSSGHCHVAQKQTTMDKEELISMLLLLFKWKGMLSNEARLPFQISVFESVCVKARILRLCKHKEFFVALLEAFSAEFATSDIHSDLLDSIPVLLIGCLLYSAVRKDNLVVKIYFMRRILFLPS